MDAEQMALIFPIGKAGSKLRRLAQFVEINPGFIPHALQKRDQIFGGKIAARSRAVRAAPEASRGGIKLADAGIEPGERVGKTAAISVVEMKRQFSRRKLEFPGYERERIAHLIGKSHAIGVADRNAPWGQVARSFHDAEQCFSGNCAFERTMEAGRNTGANRHAVALCRAAHFFKQRERLGQSAIQVLAIEGIARGQDKLEASDDRSDRAFLSPEIRNQSGTTHVRKL